MFEELYDDKEYHLNNFAKKYNLRFNLNALKNLKIQNTYKGYKHYWYQKMLVKLRYSRIKQVVKKLIPVHYWVKLTRKIEHINLVEPSEKIPVDKKNYEILYQYYLPHIEQFENITGLKTNWLNFESASNGK